MSFCVECMMFGNQLMFCFVQLTSEDRGFIFVGLLEGMEENCSRL